MVSGVIRFIKTAQRYGSLTSWILAAYNRVLRRIAGPLPLRRAIRKIRLANRSPAFWSRLGTTDLLVLEEIYFHAEYAAVAESIYSPVNLIVDLGSNAGYSLCYWHDHFPTAFMVAVEPDADNAAICRENIRESKMKDQVKLVVACVGSHSRTVNLSSGTEEWGIHMEETAGDSGGTVDVLTMKDLLAGIPDTQPIDLLKCDIEGAEAELFGDCERWINRVRNIVIELHSPYSIETFISDLERCGGRFRLISKSKEKTCPVLFLQQIN